MIEISVTARTRGLAGSLITRTIQQIVISHHVKEAVWPQALKDSRGGLIGIEYPDGTVIMLSGNDQPGVSRSATQHYKKVTFHYSASTEGGSSENVLRAMVNFAQLLEINVNLQIHSFTR